VGLARQPLPEALDPLRSLPGADGGDLDLHPGFLWLATVALTNAIVAQIFGIRYMAMLFGIVFMSHQVGSFLGPWLGGLLFDLLGSYDLVWWFCAWLGVTAALLHWPIDERRMLRLTPSRG
jgi:MFS family permease